MAYNRIYVNPDNQPFRIELKKGSINIDFSEVGKAAIDIKKPDGTILSYTANIVAQSVDTLTAEIMLQTTDVDIPGSYQAVIKFQSPEWWWGSSDRMNFIAENTFT